MTFSKINNTEKNNTDIIKSYLVLYPYWKEEYFKDSNLNNNTIILLDLFFVEQLLITIDQESLRIITDGIIYKNKGLEYIAYSNYYSESGMRNKINNILKQLNMRANDFNFENTKKK